MEVPDPFDLWLNAGPLIAPMDNDPPGHGNVDEQLPQVGDHPPIDDPLSDYPFDMLDGLNPDHPANNPAPAVDESASDSSPIILGMIAHYQQKPAVDWIDLEIERSFLALERDMLLSLATEFRDELGIATTPLIHTFSNLSHVPLPLVSGVKDFIDGILTTSKDFNCEAVFVLRRWDSITADINSFMRIFERCIDEPQLRVRLRIFNKDTYDDKTASHFIDVSPANVCMCIGGFVDPDEPNDGFEPNTKLFLHKLLKIWRDANENKAAPSTPPGFF